MRNRLIWTDGNTTGLVLRLALGIVIFPHGAQKLLGWFGGGGVSGTMGFFETLGVPALLTWLVIIAEFFGSLGLIVGFLTRLCAAGIGCVMLGAIYFVHWQNGFFMGDGGFEYHLLAVGVVLALLITGGGRASVDHALSRRKA